MRQMILNIKSKKFPYIFLIHSIYRTWNKMRYWGEFTYLYMPYLSEEAELMMKNLYTFLKHKYGEEIDLYFMDMAKQEVEGDKWDSNNNKINKIKIYYFTYLVHQFCLQVHPFLFSLIFKIIYKLTTKRLLYHLVYAFRISFLFLSKLLSIV